MISGFIGLAIVVLTTLWLADSELVSQAFDEILAEDSRVDWVLLALSWVMVPVAFYFLGCRWRALIPPPHTASGAGLAAIMGAGLLMNTALPGPVGEFGAAWFAHKRYKIPLPVSLASGVGARLIGVWMAAAAAILIWALADLPVPEGWDLAIAGVAWLIGAAGVGLGLLAFKPMWVKSLSTRTLSRFTGPGRVSRMAQKTDAMVAQVTEAQASLRGGSIRSTMACFGWSLIAHITVLIGIGIAMWSVGAEPSVPGVVFTYAATTAGVIVMFALPGSQVGWDVLFLTLLVKTAGLETPDALLVAVIVRVQQLSVMVAGAIVMSWLLKSTQASSSEE